MKVCKKCNQTYDDSQKFCAFCGEQLETKENALEEVVDELKSEDVAVERMKCYKCNTVIDGDDIFCPNCGARLDKEEENSKLYLISGSQSNDDTIFSKIMHHKLAVVCGVCLILVFGLFIWETGKGNKGEGGDDVVEEEYEDYEEIGEVCKNNVDAIIEYTKAYGENNIPVVLVDWLRDYSDADAYQQMCDYLSEKTSDLISAFNAGLEYETYIEEDGEDSAVIVLDIKNAKASQGIYEIISGLVSLYFDSVGIWDIVGEIASGDLLDNIIDSIEESRANAEKEEYKIEFYFQRDGDNIVCDINENQWAEISRAIYGIDFKEEEYDDAYISEYSDEGTQRLEFGVDETFDADELIEHMDESEYESDDESEDESMDESESDWEDGDYVHPE